MVTTTQATPILTVPAAPETTAGLMLVSERGCGFREAGGLYLECKLPGGLPILDYLIDPPRPLPGSLVVPKKGIKLIEYPGSPAIIADRVGMQHYPNVLDFVLEAERFGISRRADGLSTQQLASLSPESRLWLIHDRAFIGNAYSYQSRRNEDVEYHHTTAPTVGAVGVSYPCWKGLPDHAPVGTLPDLVKAGGDPVKGVYQGMCISLWWNDVEGLLVAGEHLGTRIRPGGWYYVASPPPKDVAPQYLPAVFCSVPISKIVVIEDQIGGLHEKQLKKVLDAAGSNGLPFGVEKA